MNVLVINCGSSSIKYQLLDMGSSPKLLAKGLVEKIGLPSGIFTHKPEGKEKYSVERSITDHGTGISLILKYLTDEKYGVIRSLSEIKAVGHRVAHGGEYFSSSVIVNEEVKEKIRACCELAPLHNPANLKGIETMESLMPETPQIATFDTSFHQTIPARAFIYGIPYKYYTDYKIRRYGFHGTSHRFVAEKACNLLGCKIEDKKIITCHLGNGASITAIDRGKSVDTSMGFTPVSGLLMGTRAGDLDLGALLYIAEKEGFDLRGVNNLINNQSGVLGISGVSSDLRDIRVAIEKGNKQAALSMEVYAYTIKKFIGSYAAALNGLDMLIFTGGIGENDWEIRESVCRDMEFFGISFDAKTNRGIRGKDIVLSRPDSRTTVVTVTTDEEMVIATDTMNLVK